MDAWYYRISRGCHTYWRMEDEEKEEPIGQLFLHGERCDTPLWPVEDGEWRMEDGNYHCRPHVVRIYALFTRSDLKSVLSSIMHFLQCVACDTIDIEFIFLSPSLLWSTPLGLPGRCGICMHQHSMSGRRRRRR